MSSYVNAYQPPTPRDPSTPANFSPDPYDLNFCLPVDFTHLESPRVKLVPFIPRLHAQTYLDQVLQYPQLEMMIPIRTKTIADICSLVEDKMRSVPSALPFAIIDKGRPDASHPEWGGSFAGVTALLGADADSLSVEIGWAVTFPAFQRTYVTSNANAILLRYLLATPDEKPHPGLGLRRVQWYANAQNAPSIAVAERLGFKMEGTLRWRVLVAKDPAAAGQGRTNRRGDPHPEKLSRDTVLLSCCADDWESGGRELIEKLIDRE